MGRLLGQSTNNHELGYARNLRDYTKNIIRQVNNEPGMSFDAYKIGGSIAYHQRKHPNGPVNQYFKSMNNDAAAIAADLKQRFPELFGEKQGVKSQKQGGKNSPAEASAQEGDKSAASQQPSASKNDSQNKSTTQASDDTNTPMKNGKKSTNTLPNDKQTAQSAGTASGGGASSNAKLPATTGNQQPIVNSLKSVDNKVWYGLAAGAGILLIAGLAK